MFQTVPELLFRLFHPSFFQAALRIAVNVTAADVAFGVNTTITVYVPTDAKGTVTGTKCIASQETLGEENTYGEKLKEKTIDNIEEVATVSGAAYSATSVSGNSRAASRLSTALIT